MADSWLDLLQHEPCPRCTRPILAMNLCAHANDGLCPQCCRAMHPRPCPQCTGTGKWRPGTFVGYRGHDPRLVTCDQCEGTGTLNLPKDTA